MLFTSFNQQSNPFGPITRSRSRNITTIETENYPPFQGLQYPENQTIAPTESMTMLPAMQYAHIVHNASQNNLFVHKNSAYMQVCNAYTRVKAEHNTIKKINEDLTAAVGSSLRNTAAGSPLVPISISNKEHSLLEADYPAIKYWKKKTYTTMVDEKKDEGNILKVTNGRPQQGKTRLAETGENVAMDYIETADGKSIDGTTASSIRAYLRSLFIELNNEALKGKNLMPTSWGTSSASMHDGILLRLYAKYPYICFCQDDWKAGYLLSQLYSTWRSGEKKKAGKAKLKTEDIKPFDGTSATPVLAKQERSPAAPDPDVDGPSPPKKACVDMETCPHAAPDLPMPANATTTASPPPLASAAPTLPNQQSGSIANTPSIEFESQAANTSPTQEVAVPKTNRASTSCKVVTGDKCANPKALVPKSAAASAPSDAIGVPCMTQSAAARESAALLGVDGADDETSNVPVPIVSTVTKATPAPIVNPLDMLFGPATGPSTRAEALFAEKVSRTEALLAKHPLQMVPVCDSCLAPNGSPAPGMSNAAPKDTAAAKDTPTAGMKRVTTSTAAKNLCYIAYLEDHKPITSAAFDKYYKNLSKDKMKAKLEYAEQIGKIKADMTSAPYKLCPGLLLNRHLSIA
ncbi:hypothetical protein B0H34DRAFT_800784 [Crassisporium funariophilum]|nr:hypothetical protein B0H34DRAFT_800784 [Crassisporium funariophilum]